MALRDNAACILVREDSKILVAERLKNPGCWQFPQGGVDRGETMEQAMVREVGEELGLSPKHFRVLESREGYHYEFPRGHSKHPQYEGQAQTYFLCRFLGKTKDISVRTKKPEFQAIRWIDPKDFKLEWLPKFKREVYRQVLRDFFQVEIS